MVGDSMRALIGSLPSVLGLASGVILFLIALVQGLVRAPDLITPTNYQTEQTAAHPVRVGEFEPDLAWPFYPFRQARADLARVRADLGGRYRKLAKWPLDAFFRGRHGSRFWWWFFFPIPVVTLSWLLTTGLTALACFAVFAAVNVVCASADQRGPRRSVWAGPSDGAGPARPLAHGGVLPQVLSRHAVAGLPVPRLRELAPGHPAGQAGPDHAPLPVREAAADHAAAGRLAAAGHLPARQVRAAAPRGAGALRDIRVAIFGDTSAGKTRFLYAAVNSLISTTDPAPLASEFPDNESREQIGPGLDVIRSGRDTVKTTTGLPFAVTCRLGTGRRATLAHLFDTAGENYRDAQMHDALGFLHDGHGFVYVLDPFSIPGCAIGWPGTTPRRCGSPTPRPATRRAPTPRWCPGCATGACRQTGSGWPSSSPRRTCSGRAAWKSRLDSAAIAELAERRWYAQPRAIGAQRDFARGPLLHGGVATGDRDRRTRRPRRAAAVAAPVLRHAAARAARCGR